MGCAAATLKYLIFVFNALCWILGIGTMVVSSLALKNYHDDERSICVFVIVLGAIVFLISFFGCCGAIREIVCLTWAYAICLLILIVGNSIIIFKYLQQIDGEMIAREDINTAWAEQLNGTDAMSSIQNSFKCCGINNSTDYINANLTIPNSCFVNGDSTKSTILYSEGCLTKLIGTYEMAEHWVTIFMWSSLSIELVAFISACALAVTFTNQKRRARY